MTLDDLRKFDLRSLDVRDIDVRAAGEWPPAGKMFAIALVGLLILIAGYYFVISKTLEDLESRRQAEQQLRQQFVVKYRQAVNLDAYREQLVQLKESFETMRRQEIANLLVEITQAGLGRGLEFKLFQPGEARPVGFYAELPISIEVTGTYHQLAEFASDVAGFPRIVTLHDLSLTPVGKDSNLLVMKGMAKTYQYQDEDKP